VLSGKLLPWRTAAECIDWSIPCPSIFERKRPLAENTLRRIAEGIRRYVLGKAEPFIVNLTHGVRLEETGKPFMTITGAHRGEKALVSPMLVGAGGPSYGGKPVDADKPFGTLMTENHQALVTAFLAKHYGGVVGHSLEQPLGAVTTVDHHSLVSASIQKLNSGCVGSELSEPLHTVTAGGHAKRASTGTTHALLTSHLVKLRGTCKAGQPVDEPMATVTAGGLHLGEVRAFLVKYYKEGGQHSSPGEPMHTIPTKDRMGLVTVMVQGQPYVIADIGMRMLQPRELYRAQGFPDSYVIDMEHEGRALSKSDQVRLCGNSVCPPMAAALVRANYAEAVREEREPLPLLAMGAR
jgi:DNA (cytosine-5)-methyltransferase 1